MGKKKHRTFKKNYTQRKNISLTDDSFAYTRKLKTVTSFYFTSKGTNVNMACDKRKTRTSAVIRVDVEPVMSSYVIQVVTWLPKLFPSRSRQNSLSPSSQLESGTVEQATLCDNTSD